MYYLSKELQSENINWTDVEFEVKRTKSALENISSEKALSAVHDLSKKINVPLSMNLAIHRTRAASREIDDALHTESIVENLNSYMKEKV